MIRSAVAIAPSETPSKIPRFAAMFGNDMIQSAISGNFGLTMSDAYGTAHPEFSREYYELGLLAEQAGDFTTAADWQRKAIQADASDPDFHVHLAIAEMGQRRYDEAGREARAAIAASPQCGDAWYLIGGIAQERLEFARAEDAYRKAMALAPMGANAEAWSRLAAVIFEQGRERDGEAVAAANEALARDPAIPEAHLVLALIADREGRRDEALALVRGVLRTRPDHRGALALLQHMTGGGS